MVVGGHSVGMNVAELTAEQVQSYIDLQGLKSDKVVLLTLRYFSANAQARIHESSSRS
jgi:hypothetical protein